MQDTEADKVVWLDLHVSLLNGTTEGLKVHAHLGDFDLYWRHNE